MFVTLQYLHAHSIMVQPLTGILRTYCSTTTNNVPFEKWNGNFQKSPPTHSHEIHRFESTTPFLACRRISPIHLLSTRVSHVLEREPLIKIETQFGLENRIESTSSCINAIFYSFDIEIWIKSSSSSSLLLPNSLVTRQDTQNWILNHHSLTTFLCPGLDPRQKMIINLPGKHWIIIRGWRGRRSRY